MNENLGELIVQISADVSQLQAGLAQAQQQIQNMSKNTDESTKGIGLMFVAMGAAITAALTDIISSAVNYGDELEALSQRTGISVETLSQLKGVAESVGVSLEELANGMRFLQKNAEAAEQGNAKLQTTFADLGITVTDSNGKVKSGTQLLMEMADAFQKMPDGTEKAAIAIQLMGRAGAIMIPILDQGSAGITELAAKADAAGQTMSSETAQSFRSFTADIKEMQGSLGGLGVIITSSLLPILDAFVKFVITIVSAIDLWSKQHPVLAQGISIVVSAIGSLLVVIGTAIGFVMLFQGTWIKLQAAFEIVIGAMSGIIPAIMALFTPITVIGGAIILLAAAWTNNWGNMRDIVKDVAESIGGFLDTINQKIVFTEIFLKNLAADLKLGWADPMAAVQLAINQTTTAVGALQRAGQQSDLKDTFGKSIEDAGTATDKWKQQLQALLGITPQVGKASAELGLASVKAAQDSENADKAWANQLNEMPGLTQKALNEILSMSQKNQQSLITLSNNLKNIQEQNQNQAFLNLQNHLNDAIALGKFFQTEFSKATMTMDQAVVVLGKSIQTNLSDAITNIVTGTETATKAFQAFGTAMIKTIVDYVAQWIVSNAIIEALRLAGLLKSTAAAVSSAATAGPAIAAAYGPAALAANVASFGGAGAAAAASFYAAGGAEVAAMAATKLGGFQEGTDSVPAMLSPGEMVIPNTFADSIRNGNLSLSGGGNTTNGGDNYNISISVQAAINSQTDIDTLGKSLGLSIEQKLRRIKN